MTSFTMMTSPHIALWRFACLPMMADPDHRAISTTCLHNEDVLAI